MSENVELLVGLLTGGVEAAERLTEKEARELVAAVRGETPRKGAAYDLTMKALTGHLAYGEELSIEEAERTVRLLVTEQTDRIEELEKDSDFLARLHGAGVDNWEGYSSAFDDEEEEA
jgi:hypothetical protein